MANASAATRYSELPLPDTTEEAWRFTDLKGFDPDSFDADPKKGTFETESMLPELEVANGAVGAKSKVVCDALILDEASRSDTYPYIRIDENDVDIGHEATVSKIGAEQLFYLMSRGLSEAEASAMIVSGFVEPITKELPLEYAVEMNRLIQLQMEGSVG